jgi:hypothetical protein
MTDTNAERAYHSSLKEALSSPFGLLTPLVISTLRDRVSATMLVLEPIPAADFPPEQYA